MNADLVQRIQGAGADPWFVEFVLAWHGVIGMSESRLRQKRNPRHIKDVSSGGSKGIMGTLALLLARDTG